MTALLQLAVLGSRRSPALALGDPLHGHLNLGCGRRLAPKAKGLGKVGSMRRVARGHHRIIVRQPPLGAVGLGLHAIGRQKVPFQHLQLLSVLQAHDVVGKDRLLDRHRWHLSGLDLRRDADDAQSGIDGANDPGQPGAPVASIHDRDGSTAAGM